MIRRASVGIGAAALMLCGCDILGPKACTDELSWRVSPTEAVVGVGRSIGISGEGLTGGGERSVERTVGHTISRQ